MEPTRQTGSGGNDRRFWRSDTFIQSKQKERAAILIQYDKGLIQRDTACEQIRSINQEIKDRYNEIDTKAQAYTTFTEEIYRTKVKSFRA